MVRLSRCWRHPCRAAAVMLVALVSSGCRQDRPATTPPGELRVLASFLPVYVFTANVVAGAHAVRVDCLLPADVGCPHEYSASSADAQAIAQADVIVLNGVIDAFVRKAAASLNPRARIIELHKAVNLIKDESGDHREHWNPHIWVSPANAVKMVEYLGTELASMDPSQSERLRRNAQTYAAKLARLGDQFRAAARRWPNRRIITVHNAFDYLARDLGLEVVGTVQVAPGESASAGSLDRLIRDARTNRPAAIFTEPQYPRRAAELVAEELNLPLFELDPCVTGTATPQTYEIVMRKNLTVLNQALGGHTR